MANKLVHAPTERMIIQEGPRSDRFDVFISHSSSNLPAVLEICDVLRNHNINLWIDLEQIKPGAWIQDSLNSALRSSRTAALILSPEGVGPWQMTELRLAIDHCITENLPLIPVLLPETIGVPDNLAFLRLINQVRFLHSLSEKAPMLRLIWAITGQRPRQISPPLLR